MNLIKKKLFMKKHKKLFIVLIIIAVVLIFNFAYYLYTNWQDFFPASSSSGDDSVSLKTYNNSKMGFQVRYPTSWVVQDNGNAIEINPTLTEVNTHFSVALRDDFKSLDDVKKTLATTVPITPVQINNASGFEYSDSPSYEAIWLSHSGQVYLIRTYSSIAEGDMEANQILATFKFTN